MYFYSIHIVLLLMFSESEVLSLSFFIKNGNVTVYKWKNGNQSLPLFTDTVSKAT